MRAVERAAGGGVARAVVLQQRAIAVLDLGRAVHRAAASPSSRRARSRRAGNSGARVARGGERAGEPRSPSPRARPRPPPRPRRSRARPRRANADRCAASSSSRLRERKRALERGDAAGMLRIDREHQAVEETAPLGGRAVEQRVHRRASATPRANDRRRPRPRTRSRGRCGICATARHPRRPADRCRCRAWPGPACPRSRPTPPRRRRLRRTPVPPWWRGAGRGRAPAARSPRSDWSCRRRSRRSAPPARPTRARSARRDSCGNWSGVRRRMRGGGHWRASAPAHGDARSHTRIGIST